METGPVRERWLGGFIRRTATGKPIYVIEKRIRGALFKVSTRRHTEDAAVRELRRFEADPSAYDPAGEAQLIRMTPELILEYRNWQVTPPPNGRGNTHDWARMSSNFLFDWLEALAGHDLRRITVTGHVKPLLKAFTTSQRQRVIALKGFYTWLRKEKGLLKHHEDPMPDMRIPESHAAKDTATGARDVPFDRVQLVYRHLREDVRDVLLLLSGTGWHLSEVMRFASSGEIRKDPTGKHLAVLVTFHKLKEKVATGLTHQAHVDAAYRLRTQGYSLSRGTLDRLISRANDAAGIGKSETRVTFGAMRHNVGNWAIEAGTDIADVARAYNHTDEKMLRQHYLRHAVPRGTVNTRVLET